MMWELIAANKRKSIFLFAGMAIILCVLGYLIGFTVYPDGGGFLIKGRAVGERRWETALETLPAGRTGGRED